MRSVHCIPWHCDALAVLLDFLVAQDPAGCAAADLSDWLLVFPHRRPRRYLLRRLLADARVPKPCRPPEMLTAGQLFAKLRVTLAESGVVPPPKRLVGRLDRVDALLACVRELARSGPLSSLPVEDTALFLPWGLRLEQLCEEFVRQDVAPQNLHYTEEHVQPFAAVLLRQLGDLAVAYEALLESSGWSTPDRDARLVAHAAEAAATALAGRRIVLAGFHQLSGLEETLFRALWEQGAAYMLHCDPALVEGTPHWSCRAQRELCRRWGAGVELLPPHSEALRPTLRFYEGFDLHSQLDCLQQELFPLDRSGDDRAAAVILPDTGLLLPVLHHLPFAAQDEPVNVSMGYPLRRSPLARLVECLLQLQERGSGGGRYYWQDLSECLRHPYLKLLAVPPTENEDPATEPGDRTLRRVLQALERFVRSKESQVAPLAWDPEAEVSGVPGGWRALAGGADPTPLRALLQRVLEVCLQRWAEVQTLGQAADALQALCDLLREHGAGLWQRFPIDAECLHRLLYNIIPTLRQSGLAQTPLERETVFAVLRQALQDERVPFESEAQEGLQVLGLLETRLLTLPRVLVLDCTDDVLPGAPGQDPLLPDPLRRLLGLPDSHRREEAQAQLFFRLLAGAREVVLLYQTGTGSGLWDEKRLPSRFVEELLWRVEQEQGGLLEKGRAPLFTVAYPVSAPTRSGRSVPKTPACNARLEQLLARGLSPSALDTYLHCPVQFYYSRVARLQPPQRVEEDGDPLRIGTLVHTVLQEFFGQRRNVLLHRGNLDPAALEQLYLEHLRGSDLARSIPLDQRLMLQKTGPILLRQYLEQMPETTVLETEFDLNATLPLAGREVLLTGRADRLDQRDGEFWVLDYKTGSTRAPRRSLWGHGALLERLRLWPRCEAPETLLRELATELQSVQLPCYCLLFQRGRDIMPGNAALVGLKDKGKETALFSDKQPPEERQAIIETLVPELLDFLLRHLLESPVFAPLDPEAAAPQCAWCDYAACCRG